MIHYIVVHVEHGLVRAAPHGIVDMEHELGKANRKVVDKLVGQRAKTLRYLGRQFSIMVLFITNGTEQIAQANSVVSSEFFQI
jgi:hypothetical protein